MLDNCTRVVQRLILTFHSILVFLHIRVYNITFAFTAVLLLYMIIICFIIFPIHLCVYMLWFLCGSQKAWTNIHFIKTFLEMVCQSELCAHTAMLIPTTGGQMSSSSSLLWSFLSLTDCVKQEDVGVTIQCIFYFVIVPTITIEIYESCY